MHGLKIVHRDIKPANILVDDSAVGDMSSSAVGDKKGPKVVLADFRGACQLQVGPDSALSFSVLKGGREATTYQYMAPEMFVWKAERSCSYATDVWAMGVCLVEMDIGQLPFGNARMRRSEMDTFCC